MADTVNASIIEHFRTLEDPRIERTKVPLRITQPIKLAVEHRVIIVLAYLGTRLCRHLMWMLTGFDHGVGHSLLVLCDAKAPHGKKWNDFKALENYLFIVSISLS